MSVTLTNPATSRMFAFEGGHMTATGKKGRKAEFDRVGKNQWENVENGNRLSLERTKDGQKGNPLFKISRPDETQAASGQLNLMA